MIVTCFFFQAEDGIRETSVTGVQTCALPIYQPPDDPIGDEGWQTVVKLRKLDSHVAVISRPGLVGALSGQRHLHLAAGERSEERRVGTGWMASVTRSENQRADCRCLWHVVTL